MHHALEKKFQKLSLLFKKVLKAKIQVLVYQLTILLSQINFSEEFPLNIPMKYVFKKVQKCQNNDSCSKNLLETFANIHIGK
jgi:hypothetical protein